MSAPSPHAHTPPPPARNPPTGQAEPDVFASTGSDRSIALYDLRLSTPLRKLVMQTRCNALAWNPMEPFSFTAANEDCSLYTYDMRKLTSASCVHKVRPRPALCVRGWMRRACALCAPCPPGVGGVAIHVGGRQRVLGGVGLGLGWEGGREVGRAVGWPRGRAGCCGQPGQRKGRREGGSLSAVLLLAHCRAWLAPEGHGVSPCANR